jgi:hypothetical protein
VSEEASCPGSLRRIGSLRAQLERLMRLRAMVLRSRLVGGPCLVWMFRVVGTIGGMDGVGACQQGCGGHERRSRCGCSCY